MVQLNVRAMAIGNDNIGPLKSWPKKIVATVDQERHVETIRRRQQGYSEEGEVLDNFGKVEELGYRNAEGRSRPATTPIGETWLDD